MKEIKDIYTLQRCINKIDTISVPYKKKKKNKTPYYYETGTLFLKSLCPYECLLQLIGQIERGKASHSFHIFHCFMRKTLTSTYITLLQNTSVNNLFRFVLWGRRQTPSGFCDGSMKSSQINSSVLELYFSLNVFRVEKGANRG